MAAEDRAQLQRFFDDSTISSAIQLFNKVISSPHRSKVQYGVVHSNQVTDRELRKDAHEAIKRIFRLRLDSSTDSQGVITIAAADPGNHQHQDRNARAQKGRRQQGRGKGRQFENTYQNAGPRKSQKEIFRELGGDYLHFTLYKENKDTLEVITYLARALNLRSHSFQFAGNKDRRAVTSQRASVYRVFPDKLANINRSLRNARIGNFEYKDHSLALGDLVGNAFHICLRECNSGNAESVPWETRLSMLQDRVRIGMEKLAELGFVNYFGLQRFGSFATRTDIVGMKLLQGDFKGAVNSILDFSPAALAAAKDPASAEPISRDDKARATAIQLYQETGRSKPALDTLPRKFSAESSLIRWLGHESRREEYRNALESIPRNLRLIYVHAYQSLIWNLAASHRWKSRGAAVVEGDLVLVNEHRDKVQAHEEAGVDAEGEAVVLPGNEDRAITADERFERARALSAEEASSGQYTVFDIVLPLPGYDILYPEYMASFYKETMGSEQYGKLDPFAMTRSWKDISLSGSYRKILAKPLPGYEWQVREYEEENADLSYTDLQKIRDARQAKPSATSDEVDNKWEGREKPEVGFENNGPGATVRAEASRNVGDVPTATTESSATENSSEIAAQQPNSEPRKRLGVALTFKLGTSQYATMALRELMKYGGAREHKPDYSSGRAID